MQPQYPGGQVGGFHPPTAQPAPPPEPQPANDGAIDCPECGEHLEDMSHRQKHAYMHWGDDLIPPYQNYDEAANRKAAILNVDPSTLRGHPRRRF